MPSGKGKLLDFASRALPSRQQHQPSRSASGTFLQPQLSNDDSFYASPAYAHQQQQRPPTALNRTPSPSSSIDHTLSSSLHGGQLQEVQYHDDLLLPPALPFSDTPNLVGGNNPTMPGSPGADSSSRVSSRRSSFSSEQGLGGVIGGKRSHRPPSLSVNYVPAKFTKLHAPGDWAHRRAKQGGGRDAFAADASRMGQMGTVDDDEGLVFQLGKGGLKAKHKPKLRWNRFKWILFGANSVLILYGMGTLISAILVWLNVFYQSDVIRVGNRTELILSTVAASIIVFTSLLGFSGILLNNRAFLAVYTLLLWVCLAFIVAPGYLTYKQRTFNLEGKINSQWSRDLGTDGRLRIQDALRCCGYFSPYIEATISPLCYPRSNEDGCKARYLKLERMVLENWYIIAFSLVPAQILIILAALLCSNHITYRFGKGLTPKRYRLDLGSMAIIMNEYASQIAAQYGPTVAAEAVNRSSVALDHYNDQGVLSQTSRRGSFVGSISSINALSTGLTRPTSRLVQAASPRAEFDSSTSSGHGSGQGSGGGSYQSPFDDRNYNGRPESGMRYTDADEDVYGQSGEYVESHESYNQGSDSYHQPSASGDSYGHGWAR